MKTQNLLLHNLLLSRKRVNSKNSPCGVDPGSKNPFLIHYSHKYDENCISHSIAIGWNTSGCIYMYLHVDGRMGIQ